MPCHQSTSNNTKNEDLTPSALPFSIAEFTAQEDGAVLGRIILVADELRKHRDDWKEGAGREHLDTMEDRADAADLFSQHRDAIVDFYDWLAARQNEIHAEELAELDALQQELQDGQKRASPLP